ncbi:hypothetical protein, partial [Enterococcus faecium]|uniref:hypothetical protein n=1 Tax=Enterococcus faecium TaxID=1352 RepID=UPI003DA0CE96
GSQTLSHEQKEKIQSQTWVKPVYSNFGSFLIGFQFLRFIIFRRSHVSQFLKRFQSLYIFHRHRPLLDDPKKFIQEL